MAKNPCSCTATMCLAFFSGTALAGNFVTGSVSNANSTISSSANWTTLRTASISIGATDTASHGCVVNASADVDHSGGEGVENQYLFTITRNDSNPVTNGGAERMLELVDNSGADDPDSKPVATTSRFTGLTRTNGLSGGGTHTFRLLGRKATAATATTTVLDASLTVLCVHTP